MAQSDEGDIDFNKSTLSDLGIPKVDDDGKEDKRVRVPARYIVNKANVTLQGKAKQK